MYTVSVWKIQAMCAVITKQQTLIYLVHSLIYISMNSKACEFQASRPRLISCKNCWPPHVCIHMCVYVITYKKLYELLKCLMSSWNT